MATTIDSGFFADADAVARPARTTVRGHRGRWFYPRLVAAILITAVMVFPLYWMVVTAFSPRAEMYASGLHLWPAHPTTENFTLPFHQFPIGRWFVNSTVITVAVTAITTVVNLLAGYAFAKLPFRGANAIFLVLLSTMMVPVQAIMIPQFELASHLHLYNTLAGVILPESATVFGIFLARQFFLAIPDELLEAARVDGAGHLKTFTAIVLPLCKPLVAVLALLTAMSEWNSFAWPLVVLFGDDKLFTLPLGVVTDLQGQYTSNYGAIMAITLLMIAPIAILFIAFQRYFVQGMARSGIK